MKTGKRRFHLPLKAYLLYFLLVTFALTCVTFSKYTTSAQGGDAARVAKMGSLSLTENGEPYDPTQKWMLVPGVNLTKDAVIRFENSEVACYVFCAVDANGFTRSGDVYSACDGLISFAVESGWDSFETADGAVYYTVAQPGQSVEKHVIAENGTITVSDQLPASKLQNAQNMSITIRASAVQYGGFKSAQAAYTASANK